jgi:hypothetical protein
VKRKQNGFEQINIAFSAIWRVTEREKLIRLEAAAMLSDSEFAKCWQWETGVDLKRRDTFT